MLKLEFLFEEINFFKHIQNSSLWRGVKVQFFQTYSKQQEMFSLNKMDSNEIEGENLLIQSIEKIFENFFEAIVITLKIGIIILRMN